MLLQVIELPTDWATGGLTRDFDGVTMQLFGEAKACQTH